jgi:HK97 family phage portal protein
MYEYEENLFENKARTGGVMESSTEITPQEVERLREEWQQKYAGNPGAGKMPILPPGLKFIKDTMTNEELSFIEGRRITREEICAGFDVPISLLDPNSIRSNVEAGQYFHAKYGIAPRLRKIEEKLNEMLLPMFDDSGQIFCAFDDPVPENRELELKESVEFVNAGIKTRNEVRADMDDEPIDGGDEAYISSLMVPLGQPPPPTPAPGQPMTPEEFAKQVKESMKKILGN